MACRRSGDKLRSEPMTIIYWRICVNRPQWVNDDNFKLECDTSYQDPWCQQCALSWNLKIFKDATWHAVIITKIKIVFDIICYVDYQSAAKFKLSISQPPNEVSGYKDWKPKPTYSRNQHLQNMNMEDNFQATLWRHYNVKYVF